VVGVDLDIAGHVHPAVAQHALTRGTFTGLHPSHQVQDCLPERVVPTRRGDDRQLHLLAGQLADLT
jgi:hypothetical protein